MTVVGWQMLIGSAALAIPAMTETWVVTWSPAVIIAILYTIFVPGLLATVLWFQLVNRIGAVRAASFHFLNPVFGVLFAAVLLGESLSVWDAIGVIIVTLAILVVQRVNTGR